MADAEDEQITISSLAKMMNENHKNVMGRMGQIENKLELTSANLKGKLETLSTRVEEIGNNYSTLNENLTSLEKRVEDCEVVVNEAKEKAETKPWSKQCSFFKHR